MRLPSLLYAGPQWSQESCAGSWSVSWGKLEVRRAFYLPASLLMKCTQLFSSASSWKPTLALTLLWSSVNSITWSCMNLPIDYGAEGTWLLCPSFKPWQHHAVFGDRKCPAHLCTHSVIKDVKVLLDHIMENHRTNTHPHMTASMSHNRV